MPLDPTLQSAVFYQNLPEIKDLINSGIDPNEIDNMGENILWNIDIFKDAGINIQIIEYLITEAGIDINTVSINGDTVLMFYAMNFPEGVSLLLDNGMNANIKNRKGETALFFPAREGYPRSDESIMILIGHGAHVNIRNTNGNTPLHYATMGVPRLEVIRVLLENGANPSIRNKAGNTPITIIRTRIASGLIGQEEILRRMLEKSASNTIKRAWRTATRNRARSQTLEHLYAPPDPNIPGNLGGPGYQATARRWTTNIKSTLKGGRKRRYSSRG